MDQQPYQPPADTVHSIMAILCNSPAKMLSFASLVFVSIEKNTFFKIMRMNRQSQIQLFYSQLSARVAPPQQNNSFLASNDTPGIQC